MANFDGDTLRELRDVQEAAIRTEKHPKSAVVIWWWSPTTRSSCVRGSAPEGAGTETSQRAGPPPWSLPAAGWCRQSRRAIPKRSRASVENS
jgi:hypothetical protein